MINDIAIYGFGGFGREVQMLIEQINEQNSSWNFRGFFDDNEEQWSSDSMYLGSLKVLNKWPNPIWLVVAIGNPDIKRKIVESIVNPNVVFPTLIHPNVYIGKNQNNAIGHGCIVTAGNIITVNTQIGNHVILNLSSTVGHDTIIGDYCSIMPGVNISGEVNVGDGVFIGTGAKIINQKNIGSNSILGAGSIVTKDIPANCTAVGMPAKVIKYNHHD